MPDYKEMYLQMVRAAEAAIQTLTAAQQLCEEMYIRSPAPRMELVDFPEAPEGERDPE